MPSLAIYVHRRQTSERLKPWRFIGIAENDSKCCRGQPRHAANRDKALIATAFEILICYCSFVLNSRCDRLFALSATCHEDGRAGRLRGGSSVCRIDKLAGRKKWLPPSTEFISGLFIDSSPILC
jgi:hypothetical protein